MSATPTQPVLAAPPAPLRPGTGPSTGPVPQGVLFTSFEPSGDDHASVVIAELRARHPNMPIYAWGGPKMERAGATIVERTGDAAVMGVPGVGKIIEHFHINQRIDDWLDTPAGRSVGVHIPVDSPDANFSICAMAKARGKRVVHLVAPQLWAWREGRIKKLRKLTDLVLCVLPFEEPWFVARAVPAKFVGHPLFNQPLDEPAIAARAALLGSGSPKLALMPGSRPGEVMRSFPPLLDAFARLRVDFPGITAVLAVTRPAVADELRARGRKLLGQWPEGLDIVAGDTDAVVAWCDMAIVASGTVTLQVARQGKPMVTFYRMSKVWRMPHALLGRMLFTSEFFTLPNLIAGRAIVPELVPHFGDGRELAVGVYRLMRQPDYAADQRAALAEICRKFEGRRAGPLAADAIEGVLGLRRS